MDGLNGKMFTVYAAIFLLLYLCAYMLCFKSLVTVLHSFVHANY